MRILSWNINGLRAAAKKGFVEWLGRSEADIVGVQETRAREEDLPEAVAQPPGWHTHFVAAERKGYSGVGLFTRKAPDQVESSLGIDAFDAEGRVQLARFGKLLVANVYFPNGSGPNRDHSRIPYKLDFYRRLYEVLDEEKHRGGRILVMGDFNTAHQDIDLARPKANTKTSGFCPEEREELDRWLRSGWTDTLRHRESGPGHYSWWSTRSGCRERNIGWRIDYVLASPGAMPFLKHAFILPEVMGSDHCPVGVEVDEGILV